jgi:hypothetical protein
MSYIWPRLVTARPVVEFQLAHADGVFRPVRDDQKQLRYMLAVCSDSDMPPEAPGGSLLLDISARATEHRLQQLTEAGHALEQAQAQVAALTARVEQAEQAEQAARALLVEAHTELLRRDLELRAAQRQSLDTLAPSAPAATRRAHERARLSLVARRYLPPEAAVLVVSLGDDGVLDLGRLRGQHFPQAVDGSYADFSLADGPGAIGHLEALRQQGAAYLLVPNSALDWFNSFPLLRQHLEGRYRQLSNVGQVCLVYALGDAPESWPTP